MFQITIPLRELVEDVNKNSSLRLFHNLQKIIDYTANQKVNIDDVTVTLTVNSVYEGKSIKGLEFYPTGV